MKALWALYWSVCQLRRGPEDMPRSAGLLALVLLLDLALGVLIQWLSAPVTVAVALGIVLLALGLDALALWGLLRFTQHEERYGQALATVYGVDFLIGLLALPLVMASVAADRSPWMAALAGPQVLMAGWNLGVRGFVYHRTLDIGLLQACMLALTLFLLHVLIAAKLFPALLASPGAP